jgi:hypothetical protein
MQILKELETAPLPMEEEEHRHTRRLALGVLFALVVTGGLLGGYFYLRGQHEAKVASAEAAEAQAKRVPVAQVEVFVDEPILKDKDTVIGGTVHNISKDTLPGLAVKLELWRRTGGGTETKMLSLDTADLAPDGKGRYATSFAASEYSKVRVVGIIGGSDRGEIPFKTLPGAQRPPEPPPTGKTVMVKRPAQKGEEFINTPNTPGRIR